MDNKTEIISVFAQICTPTPEQITLERGTTITLTHSHD